MCALPSFTSDTYVRCNRGCRLLSPLVCARCVCAHACVFWYCCSLVSLGPKAPHTRITSPLPASDSLRGSIEPLNRPSDRGDDRSCRRAPVPVFRDSNSDIGPGRAGKEEGSPTLTQVRPNVLHTTTLEKLFKRSPLVPGEIAVAKREAAAALAVERQAKKAVEGTNAFAGRTGEGGSAATPSKRGKGPGPISYKFIHREVERQKLFNSVSLSDGERELMTRQFLAGVHHGDIKARSHLCIRAPLLCHRFWVYARLSFCSLV